MWMFFVRLQRRSRHKFSPNAHFWRFHFVLWKWYAYLEIRFSVSFLTITIKKTWTLWESNWQRLGFWKLSPLSIVLTFNTVHIGYFLRSLECITLMGRNQIPEFVQHLIIFRNVVIGTQSGILIMFRWICRNGSYWPYTGFSGYYTP